MKFTTHLFTLVAIFIAFQIAAAGPPSCDIIDSADDVGTSIF
jgi:hypothetical protein